jgi:mono/diheme cytochrome c family protein
MSVSAVRGSLLCLSLAAAMALLTMSRGFADDDELTDPFLGQADAIAAGRVTYAGKCYVCHHSSGARGPNLFATKLSDQRFLETVIQGRKERKCQPSACAVAGRRVADSRLHHVDRPLLRQADRARKQFGARQLCGGEQQP